MEVPLNFKVGDEVKLTLPPYFVGKIVQLEIGNEFDAKDKTERIGVLWDEEDRSNYYKKYSIPLIKHIRLLTKLERALK